MVLQYPNSSSSDCTMNYIKRDTDVSDHLCGAAVTMRGWGEEELLPPRARTWQGGFPKLPGIDARSKRDVIAMPRGLNVIIIYVTY
uniref:Uncharacterized protein n=1 Tax=Timema douglasi TaxID=61478 RepID=A0A7R8ZA97_TIMDO|nr:unnamed protein product [Timema douglasi]